MTETAARIASLLRAAAHNKTSARVIESKCGRTRAKRKMKITEAAIETSAHNAAARTPSARNIRYKDKRRVAPVSVPTIRAAVIQSIPARGTKNRWKRSSLSA
jgi:hypothetical protein